MSGAGALLDVVGCEGAPRDLGVDQGRACRAMLQRTLRDGGALAALAQRCGSAARRRQQREIRRHFPHQAETQAGLAVGAALPEGWLAERLRDWSAGDTELSFGIDAVALRLWIRPPPDRILRRNRPEGLFASVDLTLPWLGAACAGVNERGLAVASTPLRNAASGAPAWLLAQDCLERFQSCAAALDWCRARPTGGSARMAFADAGGAVCALEIRDGERRLLEPGALGAAPLAAGADLAWLAPKTDDGPALSIGAERFSP